MMNTDKSADNRYQEEKRIPNGNRRLGRRSEWRPSRGPSARTGVAPLSAANSGNETIVCQPPSHCTLVARPRYQHFYR